LHIPLNVYGDGGEPAEECADAEQPQRSAKHDQQHTANARQFGEDTARRRRRSKPEQPPAKAKAGQTDCEDERAAGSDLRAMAHPFTPPT
jgi:hypothetical protein